MREDARNGQPDCPLPEHVQEHNRKVFAFLCRALRERGAKPATIWVLREYDFAVKPGEKF